jgi:hypothetical protein
MSCDKVTALEAELHKALLQPRGLLQKVWHALRRKQTESRDALPYVKLCFSRDAGVS